MDSTPAQLAYQSGAAKISPKSILEADVNFLGKGGVLTQHSPLWDASENAPTTV